MAQFFKNSVGSCGENYDHILEMIYDIKRIFSCDLPGSPTIRAREAVGFDELDFMPHFSFSSFFSSFHASFLTLEQIP